MFNNGMRLVDVVVQDGDDTTAVWRPGSGAQFWQTGMSLDEFKAKDDQHFAEGLRLTAEFFATGLRLVAVDKYDTDDGRRYLGVWRPGAGEQRWWSGKFSDFKAVDQDHVDHGLRIVTQNHSFGMMAVWHPGTGAQFWWSGPHDQFKAVDQGHFDAGLRLISLGVGYSI